eukprot:g38712.t1
MSCGISLNASLAFVQRGHGHFVRPFWVQLSKELSASATVSKESYLRPLQFPSNCLFGSWLAIVMGERLWLLSKDYTALAMFMTGASGYRSCRRCREFRTRSRIFQRQDKGEGQRSVVLGSELYSVGKGSMIVQRQDKGERVGSWRQARSEGVGSSSGQGSRQLGSAKERPASGQESE